MSVIIKSMKIPENCCECPLETDYGTCGYYSLFVEAGHDSDWKKRRDDCPLIELPDHGDLIDRDALKADLGITDWDCNKCQWGGLFGCKRDDFDDACFFLENAEAVIPAERSEDDITKTD